MNNLSGKEIAQNIIFCLMALCIAWGLKYHYSTAHAESLKWILAPTAALVETITRHPFFFESNIGYINQDLQIIIAPACAGINFLIAVFCMSAFCGIFKLPGFQKKSFWLIGCAAGAYIATINVNAFRIWISIATIAADIHAGWFTPQRVHRMSGIIIYFFFLSGFYHIIQKIIYLVANDLVLANDPDNITWPLNLKKQKKRKNGIDRTIHFGILPLICYWIIAIAVPWLNAAHKKDPAGFTEHSLTVGVLSLAVFSIFFLARAMSTQMKIRQEKTPTIAGIVQKL
jgi:exosortase K